MILLLRILVASALKVEAQPSGNFFAIGNLLFAVVGVDFDDVAFFFLVGGGFVVEDGVPVEADA